MPDCRAEKEKQMITNVKLVKGKCYPKLKNIFFLQLEVPFLHPDSFGVISCGDLPQNHDLVTKDNPQQLHVHSAELHLLTEPPSTVETAWSDSDLQCHIAMPTGCGVSVS